MNIEVKGLKLLEDVGISKFWVIQRMNPTENSQIEFHQTKKICF